MKQTKSLYSFSNWRYELLDFYQKNSEAKKSRFVCSRIFTLAQFTFPGFNIKDNHLKFKPTVKHK